MSAEAERVVRVHGPPAWHFKECVECHATEWATHNRPGQILCPTCHSKGANKQNRKRKKVAAEVRVVKAARHAPPPRVVLAANDEHPPELDAELSELIRWCIDMTRGSTQLSGVDVINGGFVELKIPATHEVPDETAENWTNWGHILHHRQGFDAWYAITGESNKKRLWRGKPPTLAIKYIRELLARTAEALAIHFAGTPYAHHDFTLIMGDLTMQCGNTTGQVVHCDVQHPETFCVTYLKAGYATKVANYSTTEHMDRMRKHTEDIGYSIQDITMQCGTTLSRLYGSYLSCYQLTEDDILERTEQVRAEDDDDKDVPSLFNPGTVSLVNGGFAHAANGLSDAHPVRAIIFSVGSQLGVESPYAGYEQKLIGEPDVFWAIAARTAVQRNAWLAKAKATILRVVKAQGAKYYYSKGEATTHLPTSSLPFSHSFPRIPTTTITCTATIGETGKNSPIAKVALNIKVTQQEMLKRLRGEERVLDGRGMTTPSEVGFSVLELERAVTVITDMVTYVSSPSAPTPLKALQWRASHFSEDIKELKGLIKETRAVLLHISKTVAAAPTQGR
jgi:hypothetical protein